MPIQGLLDATIKCMQKLQTSQRWGLALGLTLLLGAALAGCSITKAAELSGQETLDAGLRATAELDGFHYQLSLSMAGAIPTALDQNATELKLEANGDVAKRRSGQPQLSLTGRLQTVSDQGISAMAGTMIGLTDYTYFRVTDLRLPQAGKLPFSGRSPWYKLKQNSSQNGGRQSANTVLNPTQLVAIQNALVSVPLFEVVNTLADETVASQRSYHYQVRIKPDAWDKLAAQLGETVKLDQPISSGTSLANQLADVWVSKRDHQLTKFRLASSLTSTTGQPVDFEFELQFSKQNTNIAISAPDTAEELGSFDHWLY